MLCYNNYMNTENMRKILKRGYILKNEPMAKHTTFRSGGAAAVYAVPYTAEEACGLIRYLNRNALPYTVIGNGSNLLVSEQGYDGVVIHLGRIDGTDFVMLGYEETENGMLFDAGCGCMMSVLASIALKLGCTGFEALSGIPGCIGGALIMNAGAYGSEMKDIVQSVEVITKEGNMKTLGRDELDFGYRYSSIQKDGLIVSRVNYYLPFGDKETILSSMQDYAERRKEKQPIELPSAGSTFKRPEGYFAGKLIEDCGLKGYRIGGACVSEKHAGFIVNDQNGTSEDIYQLICHVQKCVKKQFGVELETEVKLLGEFKHE